MAEIARRGRGRSDRTTQTDARVELGGGDADPGGGGVELTIGLADIGPAGEQARAVADRDRPGQSRRCRAGRRFPREIGRWTAGEDCEPIERSLPLRLERRNGRPGAIELCAGLARFEHRRPPAFEQPPGQIIGFLLHPHAFLRDGELAPGAARIGISAGGFSRDGDAGEIESGLDRLGIGTARLDRAVDPPEQVELVGDVEPDIIGIARRAGARKAERLARLARIGRASRDRRRGEPAGATLAQHGAGAAQVCFGDAQIGIGGEGLADQCVQRRIAEKLPPLTLRLVPGEGGRGRAGEGRLRGRTRRRRFVIRTDDAARQRERADAGEENPSHHASPPAGAGSSGRPS